MEESQWPLLDEWDREEEDDDTDTESKTSDDLSEDEETYAGEKMDPWDHFIGDVLVLYKDDYEKKVNEYTDRGYLDKDAVAKTERDMLPLYREGLKNRYVSNIMWQMEMARDPVHKKIKETAKRLRDDEDYEYEESWKYATEKRKYLLDAKIKQFKLDEESDEDED